VLSDIGEDVGADVEAAEGVEVPEEGLVGGCIKKEWNMPVSLDGGDLGVVIVIVVVGGALKVLRDSIAEEDTEDAVLDGVGLVLIEGDEHKSVVHEVLVVQERGKEGLQPLASNRDGGIMAIRGHVGGWDVSISITSSHRLNLLMNIHWGSLFALRSSWNRVVFLIFSRRSAMLATELYKISGLQWSDM
jgi:hypothetical protein